MARWPHELTQLIIGHCQRRRRGMEKEKEKKRNESIKKKSDSQKEFKILLDAFLSKKYKF